MPNSFLQAFWKAVDKKYDAFWFIDFMKLTDMTGFVSFNHSMEQFFQLMNYYNFYILFGLKKESFFLYSEEYLITGFYCISHLAKTSPVAFADNFI